MIAIKKLFIISTISVIALLSVGIGTAITLSATSTPLINANGETGMTPQRQQMLEEKEELLKENGSYNQSDTAQNSAKDQSSQSTDTDPEIDKKLAESEKNSAEELKLINQVIDLVNEKTGKDFPQQTYINFNNTLYTTVVDLYLSDTEMTQQEREYLLKGYIGEFIVCLPESSQTKALAKQILTEN